MKFFLECLSYGISGLGVIALLCVLGIVALVGKRCWPSTKYRYGLWSFEMALLVLLGIGLIFGGRHIRQRFTSEPTLTAAVAAWRPTPNISISDIFRGTH